MSLRGGGGVRPNLTTPPLHPLLRQATLRKILATPLDVLHEIHRNAVEQSVHDKVLEIVNSETKVFSEQFMSVQLTGCHAVDYFRQQHSLR